MNTDEAVVNSRKSKMHGPQVLADSDDMTAFILKFGREECLRCCRTGGNHISFAATRHLVGNLPSHRRVGRSRASG